jgi:sarcosine oxidase subunit beta
MKTNIVIIGAGISGVSIAYNLAKMGQKGIIVIDKSYMTSGATGRCGAGVRQQWATKSNCEMAKRSIEFFEIAEETLQYEGGIEFKQEGYLILATNNEEVEQFKKHVELQNSIGIASRAITVDEALKIVPHLNPDSFLMATFCPTDGHLNPFLMTDAYYQAAKRLGVDFHFFENVKEIVAEHGQVQKVITDQDTYETNIVVNAAGGYAREIGLMAGVEIPVYSEKHEILVTEPISRIQGPMVMSFSKNIYCQQVPHGSFLIGRGDPTVPHDHDITSTWHFLDEMAKTVADILPKIGELRVIRQWAGSYNMSPDKQPIISDVPTLEGFFLACGFSGHGFMFAPMTGILLSEIILKKPTTLDVGDYHLHRFKTNTIRETEKSVV